MLELHRRLIHCALMLQICLIAGYGCTASPAVSLDEEPAKAIAVKTVAVVQEDIPLTTFQPATVHAYYRAEIRAKISGYVKELKVDIGDVVQAGETLAIIDVPEMEKQRLIHQARITRNESEEARASAGVQLAQANVQSAEAKLEQAKSEMSRADAALAAIEAEFSRTQDLVDRQSLESRMLDEVRKKRDSERANKQAMQSAIISAEANVNVAQAKTTSAQADLKAAQAETEIARRQLEELEVLLAYSNLKAPFAGVVTQRTVDPGDLVREGNEVGQGSPLFVVSQVEKLRVQIPVPEADAAFASRGDTVTLTFPSFSGEKSMELSITRIAGALDPSTRTMLVEAELENKEGKYLPGMFGQASISLNTKVAANMLPARAIRFDESGQAYVYVIDENQQVTVIDITTGIDNGNFIEVQSGLDAGQVVIDAHLKRFKTGQKVELIAN
ncbi:MAG TPA: efflux RND transporter periplasmic adaptor subunit [Planctomycetaceae bacterium]|nr:efflux RND transporter periplasmic adaptor subunit [Planctomycetaceae bacterium]